MDIHSQLESLGLNNRQSRVYLALLQLGSASAIELAKYTKFKHPTVYDVLEALEEKQLVSKHLVNKRHVYVPEDPQALQQDLERKQQLLGNLLPDLRQLFLARTHHTRVHCYNALDGIRTVYNDLLTVKSREYRYFGSIREMLKIASVDVEWEFYQERKKRQIMSYSIRYREGESDVEFLRPDDSSTRKVRYFPHPLPDNIAGLYIYDDKVAIISALKENSTIIIESHDLYLLMKSVWECIWQIADAE